MVCIPPGATLRFASIAPALRSRFGLEATEVVVFVQTSADVNRYRDAFLFRGNITVPLRLLPEGQIVTVLSLTGERRKTVDEPETVQV